MKKIIVLISLLILPLVSADVVINEVMYNPNFCSDSVCEWIELYNNGSEVVDLSGWRLDNNPIEYYIIKPNEFVVIVKDRFGFEEFYGNNDTIWDTNDGNYEILQGTFSLTNTQDTINLSGSNEDILTYEGSWGANGNDYSLQKIDYNKNNGKENWNESSVLKGTPGKDNFLREDNNILVLVNIEESVILINAVLTPDDSQDLGYQVLPEVDQNKTIHMNITIDSPKPIIKVKVELNNITKEAIKINDNYHIDFSLPPYLKAGNYKINITAYTLNSSTSGTIDFQYLGLISTSIDNKILDFGYLIPGRTTGDKQVKVFNKGNVEMNIEMFATDLIGKNNIIPAGYIKGIISNSPRNLTKAPQLFELNLVPGMNSFEELLFRIESPVDAVKDSYSSTISVVALES